MTAGPNQAVETHLFLDVIKRVRRINSETNQDDVGVRVGKRAEPIVVFLTSRIPKSELNMLAIDLNVGDVVLKDSGDVDLIEVSQFDESQRAIILLWRASLKDPSREGGWVLTSGKVPFEKTLQKKKKKKQISQLL